MALRTNLRSFFHWKYSQFFIGGLFASGVAMLTYNHFPAAQVFFLTAGLWAVIYWQVSNLLTAKALELQRRRQKREQKPHQNKALLAFRKANRSYWLSNGLGCLLLLGLTVASLVWTRSAEIEYELGLPAGWLLPANDPTPPSACYGDKSLLLVFFGTLAAGASTFPNVVFSAGGVPRMTIDKNERGELAVTTDIYDENQNVVVSIDKNKFTVSNDVFQVQRPDVSTLVVVLKHGKERVLDVRFLNKKAIRVRGHFRYPNAPEMIASDDVMQVGGARLIGAGNCATNGGLADFAF